MITSVIHHRYCEGAAAADVRFLDVLESLRDGQYPRELWEVWLMTLIDESLLVEDYVRLRLNLKQMGHCWSELTRPAHLRAPAFDWEQMLKCFNPFCFLPNLCYFSNNVIFLHQQLN